MKVKRQLLMTHAVLRCGETSRCKEIVSMVLFFQTSNVWRFSLLRLPSFSNEKELFFVQVHITLFQWLRCSEYFWIIDRGS